jgi:TatD DNase family protein
MNYNEIFALDIGANLTDAMYSGIYNGTRKHEGDLQQVLQRSWNAGLKKIIITGGNLKESQMALSVATNDGFSFEKNEKKLFCY